MDITYSIKENSEEEAIKAENMRRKVYGIESTFDVKDSYYTREISQGNILLFTCEINEITVAACYISNSFNSLYVEYLFVLPEYQEKSLHLGKNLLQYICDNKKIVEEYFNCKLNHSLLSPTTEKSRAIYESMGYKVTNKILNIMRKNV